MRSKGLSKSWVFLLMGAAAVGSGCVHTREPERALYLIAEDASAIDFRDDAGAGGAGAEAYCNELQIQCYDKCIRRKPELPSIKKHSGMHKEFCTTKCRQEFMECVKKQEEIESQESTSTKLRFSSIDDALKWLRSHAPQSPPGTNVIVAGTGFVIVMTGGALFLSPI